MYPPLEERLHSPVDLQQSEAVRAAFANAPRVPPGSCDARRARGAGRGGVSLGWNEAVGLQTPPLRLEYELFEERVSRTVGLKPKQC